MRYDYGCPKCGFVQEETHSIKEDPEIKCANCDHTPMTRHICTNPQIVFKGEGWATKRGRIDSQMRGMLAKAEHRQEREWGHLRDSKVAPNVQGQFTGEPNDPKAWREAAKLAKEKGFDPSSYEAKAVEIESRNTIPDHLKKSQAVVGGGSETGAASSPSPAPKTDEMPVNQTPAVASSD